MKLPKSYYNLLSYFGTAMATFFLFLIILMFSLTSVFDFGNQYSALFTFIILPIFLVIGLLLIPIGMIIRHRKDKKRGTGLENKFLVIDINKPQHRNWYVIFLALTAVLLALTAMGSYEAFHYTESVEFCGEVCHEVMEPEFVTYQHSSHANVSCAECHVGAGASWYVKSKLSGLYQVYSILAEKYPTPIPTPIEHLRPARETCEKCHWPEKFYDNKLRNITAFLADEENSEWFVQLQMLTGPNSLTSEEQEGSHWHIDPNVQIEFSSEQNKREIIKWVKYTDKETGEVTTYFNEDDEIDSTDLAQLDRRTMDCMDCHNRPSHSYKLSQDYVDNLIITGKVPKSIPNIKYITMEILKEIYDTKEDALKAINDEILNYYQTEYADYYASNKDLIVSTIKLVQKEYTLNNFPRMKADYYAYPNHIGHMETDGCFRCHNDTFKSNTGRVISKDCNLCHSIMVQGKPDSLEFAKSFDSLPFKHPTYVKGKWKKYNCSECHAALYE
jgi:NapC/NirT cytochrome c family protein